MFLSAFLYFMKIYQESIYNSSKVQKPEVLPVFLSSSLYADSTACSMRLCAIGFIGLKAKIWRRLPSRSAKCGYKTCSPPSARLVMRTPFKVYALSRTKLT